MERRSGDGRRPMDGHVDNAKRLRSKARLQLEERLTTKRLYVKRQS